jgi:nitrate reductase gamma subunit
MPLSVIRGFFIMVVLVLTGIVGIMAFGTMIDYLVDYTMNYRVLMGWNIPEAWDTTPAAMSVIPLIHIVFRVLPIIGIFAFIISIFEKTRYDSYTATEDEFVPWEGY